MTEIINKQDIQQILDNGQYPMLEIVQAAEKAAIEQALIMALGNQTKAAEILRISRITLHKRLVKFGIK